MHALHSFIYIDLKCVERTRETRLREKSCSQTDWEMQKWRKSILKLQKRFFFSDFFTLSDILTPSCTFHTLTSNIHNHPSLPLLSPAFIIISWKVEKKETMAESRGEKRTENWNENEKISRCFAENEKGESRELNSFEKKTLYFHNLFMLPVAHSSRLFT